MKKILLSIISVIMLCSGIVLSACGGGDVVSAIVLESSSFANDDKDYIEMDITTEDNPSVTIKANIENQENGRVSVVNPSNKVSVSTDYNASINSNTITITALEEGTTDLVIKAMSGVVEDKKVRIYVYSDITGLAQKQDNPSVKKTQYIVMDTPILLDRDTYLDISAKSSCNRKDIVWSVIEDYGNSLTITDGNRLYLNSDLFKEYKKTLGEDLNQITIQAQSKFRPEIVTEVTLDILTGIDKSDATIQGAYDLGGTKFDLVDADGNIISHELVRTNSADEHSVLYYFVDIKTENNLTWVALTDEVLFRSFGIPTGTLDITNELYSYDDATKTHSFVFKVVNENSQSPANYEINFSFAYDNYDYVFTTQDIKISLIDIVTKIEVTNDSKEVLNDRTVEIYNSYANGKGHFFNVDLTPTTAKDTTYYLKLKVARDIADVPGFNFSDYVQIYTEAGGLINFALDTSIADDDYAYYDSAEGTELRTFLNGTRIYAISMQPSSAFSLCFYSTSKVNVHTTVDMKFVYAPTENFDIEADSFEETIETSTLKTKTISFKSTRLASVDVSSLKLVYEKSENYEISALTKTGMNLSFEISVLKTDINKTFNIGLAHNNGFVANSEFEIELFRAITSAEVSLLKANSNNIAQYAYGTQTFGGGSNYSLSQLIVNFGTGVELDFEHDAGDDVVIELFYFVNGLNGIEKFEGLDLETEIATFFAGYDKSKAVTDYMEYIPSIKTLSFMTSKRTDYRGYVVVEFNGYDIDHNPTTLYRIIDVESYVPVSMLSTKKTLIETIASDSLSALDAETLSSKNVDVKFRNDPISVIPITYYEKVYFNDVVGAEKPNFTIYSSSATRAGASGSYEFRAANKTLYYNGLPIYSLNDFTVNSKSMNFDIYAYSTSDFTEFVDTLVIEYNSFFSTFRLSIDIVISNSQRVTSLIWENATDDGTMYLLLSADGSIGPNNKHTIITTVSEAYNTNLVYKYNALSGQNNVISFADNGKYKDVVVNPTSRIGGNGYIYVLPADSVKSNDQISYNYYDDNGQIATGYVALGDLNYKKGEATWYDYLVENAFFIDAEGKVVPFSQILVRIYLIVADGLSEETALRIYTAEEVAKMSYVNHYVLMNDVKLTMAAPLYDYVHGEPEISFIGSIRGYSDDVTITMTDSTALFYQIGAGGKVADLTFNGNIKTLTRNTASAFVAHRNSGVIDNVTIDVYYDGTRYVPSEVKGLTYVGAIVQENPGTIKNSSVLGVSLAGQTVGGIAGQHSGTIDNCRVELYKFATAVAGETQNNTFEGSAIVGGIAGIAKSVTATITSSYIYDYTLDNTATTSNLKGTLSIGAFVGGEDYEETDNISIKNSFAVANIRLASPTSFIDLEDCYISYFKEDGTIKYHSDTTITNPENWIMPADAAFNPKANGYGDDSFAHLEHHQLEFVDISQLEFVESRDFIKVDEKNAILFLYEVDSHTELTTVEKLALSRKNTYSLETLFGVEERLAEGLAVSSSDENIVETNISSIEVKKTGKITLNVLSKQDFSVSEPYTIEVIRVIKDFKANYNGYETTGIEVQEGRSAQIDFTTLNSTYLNSSTNFSLILDKFVVTTDNTVIEKGGVTYAAYTVENSVGMINVYAGAKTEVGTFVVNSYISLSTLNPASQAALKAYSLKELTITPFEGSNEIGVDYSSLTLYPSLSTHFEVVLDTDSATDGLIITGEYEGTKLTVYKVEVDKSLTKIATKQIVVNPAESGEFVLAFGDVDKRISLKVTSTSYNITTNEIIYSVVLRIYDEYKSSVSSNEKYKIFFNSKNDKELALTRTLDIVLESQKIDNIDVTNYKISQVSNKNGVYHYTKTNASVTLMAPGQSSIFEVTVDPKYSYYEYLTVNYVPQGNALLTFSALNKQADGGYVANNDSSVTNIAYGIKVIPTVKTSVYAFKLYVSTNIDSDCIVPITVSFFGYNKDGSPKLIESREVDLFITCMKQPSVLVNGSEFTKIAKGSEAKVEVTVNTDQDLESITLEGTAIQNISLSHQTTIFNQDGTKTYIYKLKASVTASVDYNVAINPSGVGQFEIKGTIARVLDGVRETKSMSAMVALVEFDVSSVEIYGAEYDEALGLDLFTAYENVTKNFEFAYNFIPESYGTNLTAEELAAMQRLNERKAEFSQDGYYTDGVSYYINHIYNDATKEYTPIMLKDQLYVVSSTGKEQKLNWTAVSGQESTYSYTHYEGSYAKFKITYNDTNKQFVIMGNSTTSSSVLFRLKNITYLNTAGTNVYWESNYNFAIRVKSYTSEDSPEAINNAQDFLDIKKEGEAKPYILMNDIVLENYEPFDTTLISSLDGNGHTIHLNSFDKSKQTGTFVAALFTNVASTTTLKNLRVNWYNGGQISVDTAPETGFGGVQVAGLAVTNNGIIYNCEAVAYFDERYNTEVAGDTGLIVSYTRGQTPYYIDGNSSVISVVAGLVVENSGNITNSRVGGETLRILDKDMEDLGLVGRAYYKDIDLDVFTISGQGEVNGFVSNNSKSIAASRVANVQINNLSAYNLFETSGFVNTNSGEISTSYIAGHDDGTATFTFLSTSIDSDGIIAGFVMNNSAGGSVTNCMSNILISNTSVRGSGFVYKNEGLIGYCFSASQVEKSSFTQMGFTGLDEKGDILSDKGEIKFSYYYDMNFSTGATLEHQIDTGALLLDLGASNSVSQYYGLSFASGETEEEMLENADGIWYMKEDGKISLIAADTISYSIRYIAGVAADNSFLYVYSDMIDNDVESYNFGNRYTTQYGSKYNPIIIASAQDFDEAMGNSKSTNISSYYNSKEVFGSYRFVNDISLSDLGTNSEGNVSVSSTAKALTYKTDRSGKVLGIGQVDGNGFKVENISIATNDKSVLGGAHSFGLFASLTNGAKVLNLDLGILNVTAKDTYVVGGLAGLVYNSSVVNVTVDQNYTINSSDDSEASEDGILGQNVAGGVIGVAFGYSTIKSVTINNAITKVSYYDSNRNAKDTDADGKIDTYNDYYINGINLIANRTNLLTNSAILSMFSSYSIAGGIVGYADVFGEEQRVQTTYIHQAAGVREYRIKNMLADKTVNVRGEVAGGLFGYTSPTTNIENIKLRLSVDVENGSFISKILSYNSYAGGIVGLGNGYIYRATLEHDDATQKLIEEGYTNYYQSGDEEGMQRGILNLFYTTYSGPIAYDYKTQVIGGIAGVMLNGEIENSYSKLNVIGQLESGTIAGGIIGRVSEKGTIFSFMIDAKIGEGDDAQTVTTSSSVMLKEVYASGDVRGGYYKVARDGGDYDYYGFGGGIVGILDRNAVLGLQSVNAVNAFGYEDVVTTAPMEGQPKTGELTSVAVYALVSGEASSRGTIRIIMPPEYDKEGDASGVSDKSIGYYSKIRNLEGDTISIDLYPGVLRVDYVPQVKPQSTFEIISVSNFTGIIDGYNSVLSAFLVGEHWNPTKWEHTDEFIYPQIKYTSIRTFYFLDRDNVAEVVSHMQNSDVTVYVRGLDEDTGTYGDVDLSSYTIVGFDGELIGPAGWLDEEELANGVIARHQKDGPFVGINLQTALFVNSKSFSCRDLDIVYGVRDTDPDKEVNDDKQKILNDKIVEVSTSGSAFISGLAENAKLNNLTFHILNHTFTISPVNGNAGFIASTISNCDIENCEIIVNLPDGGEPEGSVIGVANTEAMTELNVGVFVGHLDVGGENIIEGNKVTVTNLDGTMLAVTNTNPNAKNIHIGGLIGLVDTTSPSPSTVEILNFSTDELIKFNNSIDYAQVSSSQVYIGGQLGKITGIKTLAAAAAIATKENNVRIQGNYNNVNYGGVIGNVDSLETFALGGAGLAGAKISRSNLINEATIQGQLTAGGVFGYAACDFAFEGSATSKLGNYFGFGNSENAATPGTYYNIAGGNIGGIIGKADSKIIISSIDAEIMVGEKGAAAGETIKKGVCQNLGNTNIGGLIGQNNQPLIVNNTDLRGYISANTTGFIGGGIGIVSSDTYVGTKPQSGDTNYISSVHDALLTGGVTSSVDIITNGSIGGFIGMVDADKKVKLTNAMYKGTIQLFTTEGQANDILSVGGVIGVVAQGTSGSISEIEITKSIFGGTILVLGNSGRTYYENTDTTKSVLIDDLSLTIGGIVGEFKYAAAANPVGQISSCYSYGDVIVSYQDKFTKLASYVFGGIVGAGCSSNISSCVSMMTSNNDKKVGTYTVGPIIGNENGSTLGSGATINKYNSSICLCYDDNSQDIGYYTPYTSDRVGRNSAADDNNTTDNAISLIEAALKEVYGDTYVVSDEIKGSKLNPHQYSTNTAMEVKTRMFYITMSGNVEVGEGKTVSPNNGLYIREKILHNEYKDEDGAVYNFGIAFIGDGYSTTSTLKYSSSTSDYSHSIFNVMNQNDIISGVVANVDLAYDLNINKENNVYAGALVGKMEGGIIFASGATGNLSVGAYYNNGTSGSTATINLGGLVGLVESGIIHESYSAVNLVYRAGAGAGGRVSGFANVISKNPDIVAPAVITSHIANVDIFGCFSTGKVETYCSTDAYAFAYGEQGASTTITLKNCYTVSQIDKNDHTTEVEATGEAKNFDWAGAKSDLYYSKDATYVTDGGSGQNAYGLATNNEAGFTGWKKGSGLGVNYGYPVRNFGYLQRSTKLTGDVYLIPNAEVLAQIKEGSNNTLSYKLEHDIDLSKTASYKDGSNLESFANVTYSGTFDGNNKTIDNLKYVGLFAVTSSATIQNLRLTNVNATVNGVDEAAEPTKDLDLGAVARQAMSTTISGVTVTGILTMGEEENSVGALIGWASGKVTISNCKNYARIVGNDINTNVGGLVGGIAGGVADSSFTNCTNYGTIEAKKTGQVGGILGAANGTSATFTQCGNTNSVLCGYQDVEGNESYFTGSIYYAGGIVGPANQANISQSYNTAMIKAGNIKNKNASYAGGIAANVTSGSIVNCLNEGMIEALSCEKDAKTTYEFTDNDTIKFTYNSGNITRVYANAFGNGITASTSVNYATVRKNGLFGSKAMSKDFKFDNMNGGFGATKTENGIVVTVEAKEQATVYITQQDELGGPASFFITVPRKVEYPKNDGTKITRKQEISCSGTFNEGDTYSSSSVVNAVQTDGTDSTIWHTKDGIYYLAFMETSVDSEAINQNRIGASLYDLPENENQLYMSINQYAKTLTDEYRGAISGKTIKSLYDADYKFEVEITGNYSAYGITGLRGVANYNDADGGYLDITLSFNFQSLGGGAVTPTINYTIKAKKSDVVQTATLQKSNLLWKKRLPGFAERTEGYYVIYLDDEVLNGTKNLTAGGTTLNAAQIAEVKEKLKNNNGKYFKVTFVPTEGETTIFSLVKYNFAENCFVIMDTQAYDDAKYPDGLIPVLNRSCMTFDINQNNTMEAKKVITGAFTDFTKDTASEVEFDKTLSFKTSATFGTSASFTFSQNFTNSTSDINNVEIDSRVTDTNSGNYYDRQATAGTTTSKQFAVDGYNFKVDAVYGSVISNPIDQATSGSGNATLSTATGTEVNGGSTTAGSLSIDGHTYTFGYASGLYYINGISYGSGANGNVELNGRPYGYIFNYDSGTNKVNLTLNATSYHGSVSVPSFETFTFKALSGSQISINGGSYIASGGYYTTASNSFKVTASVSGSTMTVTMTLVKYEYVFSNPTVSFSNVGNDYVDGTAVNVTTDELTKTNISEITRASVVYGTLTPKYKITSLALNGSLTDDGTKVKFNVQGTTQFDSSTFTPSTTFSTTDKDYYDEDFKIAMKTSDNKTYGSTDYAYANYLVTFVGDSNPTKSGIQAQVVVTFSYTIKDVAVKLRGSQYATVTKTSGTLSSTMQYDIKTNNIKVTDAAGTVKDEAFTAGKVYKFTDGGAGTYSFEVIEALAKQYDYKYNLGVFEFTGGNNELQPIFDTSVDQKLHLSVYKKSDSAFVTDNIKYNTLIDTGVSTSEILPGNTPTVDASYIYLSPSVYTSTVDVASPADTQTWSGNITVLEKDYNWSATTQKNAAGSHQLQSITFDGSNVDLSNLQVTVSAGGMTINFVATFQARYYNNADGSGYKGVFTLTEDSGSIEKETKTITVGDGTLTKVANDKFTVNCDNLFGGNAYVKGNIDSGKTLTIKFDASTNYFRFEDRECLIKINGVTFVLNNFDGTTATITYYYGRLEKTIVAFGSTKEEKTHQVAGKIYASFNFEASQRKYNQLAYEIELGNLHWAEVDDTQNLITKEIVNNTTKFDIPDYPNKDYYQIQQNGTLLYMGTEKGYVETDGGKKVEVFGVRTQSTIALITKYKVYSSDPKSFSASVSNDDETAAGTILTKDYHLGELMSGGADISFSGIQNISGNGYIISYSDTHFKSGINMFIEASGYIKEMSVAASIFVAEEDKNVSIFSDKAEGSLYNIKAYGSIAIKNLDSSNQPIYKKVIGVGFVRDMTGVDTSVGTISVYVNFSTYYNKFDSSTASIGSVGYYNTFYNITAPAEVYTFNDPTPGSPNSGDESYTLNAAPEISNAKFYGVVVGFDGKDGENGQEKTDGSFANATDGFVGQTVSLVNKDSSAILFQGRGGDGGKGRDGNNGSDYTDTQESSYEASAPEGNTEGADGATNGGANVHRDTLDGKNGYIGFYGLNLVKYGHKYLRDGGTLYYNAKEGSMEISTVVDGGGEYYMIGYDKLDVWLEGNYIKYSWGANNTEFGRWGEATEIEKTTDKADLEGGNLYMFASVKMTFEWTWDWVPLIWPIYAYAKADPDFDFTVKEASYAYATVNTKGVEGMIIKTDGTKDPANLVGKGKSYLSASGASGELTA